MTAKRVFGEEFEKMMSLPGDTVRQVKDRETVRADFEGEPLFIKKHMGVSVAEVVKNFLQLKWPIVGALPEYLAINALAEAGVSVPRVHSFGVAGWCWFSQRSFIAMHEVKHECNLEQLVKGWASEPPKCRYKRALIKEVAAIARKMHTAGINHRDFYLCHFLLADTKEPSSLTLIDLHRAKQRPTVPLRWQVKDLSGLMYSATGIGLSRNDLYCFICEYHQCDLKTAMRSYSALWQLVDDKMKALYVKKGRYPR